MSNSNLGEFATQEIRAAMFGLKGRQAKAVAVELSQQYQISLSRVYAMTEDLRPQRKQRSDKGKRRADLLIDPGLRFVAELAALKNVKPRLAIQTAKLNGYEITVSEGTAERYLRENGLSRNASKAPAPYRRVEAERPGQQFQFDTSAVKLRWYDRRTRRILKVAEGEINANHPNKNADLVNLWKFSLVDKYSRFRYVRFIPCARVTSNEVCRFLLQAFRVMGVPEVLYTDNASEIVGKRMQRAAALLNNGLAESGGFRLEQHLPHNSKATGAVESTHRWVEEFEKLIGVKYKTPALEEFDGFCEWFCEMLNYTESRATGEKPAIRFNTALELKRLPPPEIFDAAFLADEYTRKINGDLTLSINSVRYQLPRTAILGDRRNPFLDWVGKTVTVLLPPQADFFIVVGLDEQEYTISRTPAQADKLGEFKQTGETTRQRNLKALKQSAQLRKQAHKEAGTDILVPGFDSPSEVVKPLFFPTPEVEMDAAALPGVPRPARLFNYYEAVELLQTEEVFAVPPTPQDATWLTNLIGGRKGIEEAELRTALERRNARSIFTLIERRA